MTAPIIKLSARRFVSQCFIENEHTGKLIPCCAPMESHAPDIATIRQAAAQLFSPLAKQEPVLIISRRITP